MDTEKAQQILLDIEDKILNSVNLGFDPEVLDLLNNPDASEGQIELLKAKIGDEILARLFNIANSVYYGQLKRGPVDTFYKVVSRLGMDFTRVLIIFLAFAALSKDKEVKIIFAKSFATSLLGGRILAKEFGLRDNDAKKVELGGLLLEIGKIIIAIYRSLYNDDYEQAEIEEDFISQYHSLLGLKIVDKFKLPEFLKDMISTECLTLETELISLSGIVIVAYSLVDLSFRRFGNKLVIASPMPDPDGTVVHTIGAVVEETFKAVGLAGYIEIIRQSLPNRGWSKG
ncbi:MAG: HDOD domain-containing protein [Deltaproteobacteria bacterium]|nr:HDOD domain-containing protein [Deltaproteobacteria bacterium]